jgi:hypothetical protein
MSISLSTSQVGVFRLVDRAIFANPFGEERESIDRELLGGESPATEEDLLAGLLSRIETEVGAVREAGGRSLDRFSGDDRLLMERVFLFLVYHRYFVQLNEHILAQLASPGMSIRVPFAEDAIRELRSFGFTAAEADRYFGLFFQLRRAFHFIQVALIGESASMRHLRMQLWNNVFTVDLNQYSDHLLGRMEDFSTLILGETGSGKGAAAAAIGRSGYIPFRSGRFSETFTGTFTAINLSRFPESLIESELFGHRKGAFTGAVESHEGVLSRCSALGSIFLDEVGELNESIQIKLLQVLQERTFSPVGSHDEQRFNGRIIAATNRSLGELRSDRFRDDFYYRLCSDVILVPSLRTRLNERPEELGLLVEHLLHRMVGDAAGTLLDPVMEVIRSDVPDSYPWTGNVRELEQCVRRVLLTRRYRVDPCDANADLRTRLVEGIDAGSMDVDSLVSGYCRLLYDRIGSFVEVGRVTGLDRRTVKRYVEMAD